LEVVIHQVTRNQNLVVFRVGLWISWPFVFSAVSEEAGRKTISLCKLCENAPKSG